MMKNIITSLVFFGTLALGCVHRNEKLATKSFEMGDAKCIVQQMPGTFQEGTRDSHFDYFRVIIQSRAPLAGTGDMNLANFGFENSIRKIITSDTVYPAFVQRIANGKKESYEYIVSFEKERKGRRFDICIDDHVFGLGPVSLNF